MGIGFDFVGASRVCKVACSTKVRFWLLDGILNAFCYFQCHSR